MLLHGVGFLRDPLRASIPMALLPLAFVRRAGSQPSQARACSGWLVGTALGLGSLAVGLAPLQAGPVLCTTTLEAPLLTPGQPLPPSTRPTEVTRCGVVGTVPEWVEQRYFSYRAPFARGVDLTHQITDLLGLAMGGGDGTRLMGLGFPDQAIIWDGSAIENTTTQLMDQQVNLVPRRTADLSSPYTTSIRSSSLGREDGAPSALTYPPYGFGSR